MKDYVAIYLINDIRNSLKGQWKKHIDSLTPDLADSFDYERSFI